MKTSEFSQLLQNEMILPRDPHLVDRFTALLDENFEAIPPKEPSPEDGVNVVLQEPSADCSTSGMHSALPLPTGTVVTESTEIEPPDHAGKAMDEEADAIQESEAS
jgi:hypothetical protein